jgi:hypothetical protein
MSIAKPREMAEQIRVIETTSREFLPFNPLVTIARTGLDGQQRDFLQNGLGCWRNS